MKELSNNEIEKLIKEYEPLRCSILHKYKLYNDADAQSASYQAMYDAILTYNPNNKAKAKLSSYMYTVITNRILDIAIRHNREKKHSTNITSLSDYNENLEAVILKSNEDIAKEYVIKQYCAATIHIIKKIIARYDDGLKKQILTKWFYKYHCQCSNKVLIEECGCSSAYVRKVLMELRNELKWRMEFWDE